MNFHNVQIVWVCQQLRGMLIAFSAGNFEYLLKEYQCAPITESLRGIYTTVIGPEFLRNFPVEIQPYWSTRMFKHGFWSATSQSKAGLESPCINVLSNQYIGKQLSDENDSLYQCFWNCNYSKPTCRCCQLDLLLNNIYWHLINSLWLWDDGIAGTYKYVSWYIYKYIYIYMYIYIYDSTYCTKSDEYGVRKHISIIVSLFFNACCNVLCCSHCLVLCC